MKVRQIALISLFIAAIAFTTMSLTIAIFQGYLNFGDVLVMGMGLVIGLPYAFLAGVGAALADILLGYGQYAFFTLVIKGLEAAIIAAFVLKKGKAPLWSYLLAGTWMAAGYGLTDAFLASNPLIFIQSFGLNILQGLVCGSLAYSIQPLLMRLRKSYFI